MYNYSVAGSSKCYVILPFIFAYHMACSFTCIYSVFMWCHIQTLYICLTNEKLAPLLLWNALRGTNWTMSLLIFSPYLFLRGLSSASRTSCVCVSTCVVITNIGIWMFTWVGYVCIHHVCLHVSNSSTCACIFLVCCTYTRSQVHVRPQSM